MKKEEALSKIAEKAVEVEALAVKSVKKTSTDELIEKVNRLQVIDSEVDDLTSLVHEQIVHSNFYKDCFQAIYKLIDYWESIYIRELVYKNFENRLTKMKK